MGNPRGAGLGPLRALAGSFAETTDGQQNSENYGLWSRWAAGNEHIHR